MILSDCFSTLPGQWILILSTSIFDSITSRSSWANSGTISGIAASITPRILPNELSWLGQELQSRLQWFLILTSIWRAVTRHEYPQPWSPYLQSGLPKPGFKSIRLFPSEMRPMAIPATGALIATTTSHSGQVFPIDRCLRWRNSVWFQDFYQTNRIWKFFFKS